MKVGSLMRLVVFDVSDNAVAPGVAIRDVVVNEEEEKRRRRGNDGVDRVEDLGSLVRGKGWVLLQAVHEHG